MHAVFGVRGKRVAAALTLLLTVFVAGCSDSDSSGTAPTPTPTGARVTLTGTCSVPGNGQRGLGACAAGTPVTVFRCDDRARCLNGQGRTLLATTTVTSAGTWSASVPAAEAIPPLIFEAVVSPGVIYRALGFGAAAAPLSRAARAVTVPSVTIPTVTIPTIEISPVTEAQVELLASEGFENYSDTGAQQVMTAVTEATAHLSFAGLTPQAAAQLALQTASADAAVMMLLQTAKNTPTPTAPILGGDDTPTPTPGAACCDCGGACFQNTGEGCGTCTTVFGAACSGGTTCATFTPTQTPTPTATPLNTSTPTPSATSPPPCCDCGSVCFQDSGAGCGSCTAVTNAACGGTACVAFTPTPTQTGTFTISPRPSATPTITTTFTPSVTHTPTPTFTPTRSFTETPTSTSTVTRTSSPTHTLRPTSTASHTPTVTGSPTQTPTITLTHTATSTPTITPTHTVTPTWTRTPTVTPSQTFTPTVQCTPGVADICSQTHTTLFAIAHAYTDPVNTVLYRVTVPAWSPGTNWGDGNNGFFYQVTLAQNGTAIATHSFAPFNGVGVSSSGQPELLPFSFVVAEDISAGADQLSLSIAACSSNYTFAATATPGSTPTTGSQPNCTKTYWTDTYGPTLITPIVGPPPGGTQSLTLSTSTATLPNTGVYPAAVTVMLPSGISTTEAQWIYDHLVFVDQDGNAYSNDLSDVSNPSRRSFGALPLETAGHVDPSSTSVTAYRTKYGPQTAQQSATFPDQLYYLYSRDQYQPTGQSPFSVGVSYIYDSSSGCTALAGAGTRCSAVAGSVNTSPAIDVYPSSSTGQGSVSISVNDEIPAGFQEIRSFTLNSGSGLCTAAVNPLAINTSSAYNQPNYILDQQSGTWGASFPSALYYVSPTGFGNCDSAQTPFCERTSNYVGYVPHYADANGYGTLNGGSATGSQIVSFQLADEYQIGAAPTNDTNRLVWFDNCGYGSTYSDTDVGGRIADLPAPPNSGKTYIYTIENKLGYPVVFSKECCASYYQQNLNVDPVAYEPPQQIDNSYGVFIAAGQSLTYETLFSDEAIVVYEAGTGAQLFKLRLNAEAAVYSCSESGWEAGITGSGAAYTVTLGSGGLTCGTVGSCPFGMTASVSGEQVTCTTTTSSFLLGLPDWKSELTTTSVQLRAWGGAGHEGGECSGSSGGGAGGTGGFALSVLAPSDLPDELYTYIGTGGSTYQEGGASTVLATTPLSTIADPLTIKDPVGFALLVAGGGGGGGHTYCSDGEGFDGGSGGAGGTAIADAVANATAVSAAGDNGAESQDSQFTNVAGGTGGNPSPYEGGAGSGGSSGTNGLGGFGTNGNNKWDDSGSLIPPPDACATPPPTPTPQAQGQWCAGNGGAQHDNGGAGGGGFGGGGGGTENANHAGSGGGGGGSWSVANTVFDPSAPIDAVPASPGGTTGAVQFVYYTGTLPIATCTLSTTTASVACTLSTSYTAASLEDIKTLAASAAGSGYTIADDSPMWIRAWGGSGGAGSSSSGGSQGLAQFLTSIADYESRYSTTALYYYVGEAGDANHDAGKGGASSIVSNVDLSQTAACSPSSSTCTQNILLIAGGGGGGGGNSGEAGGAGGQAIASVGANASGAGSGSDDAGGGSGGSGGSVGGSGDGGSAGNGGVGGMGGPVHVGSGASSSNGWSNGTPSTIGTDGQGGEGRHDSSSGKIGGGGGGGWGGGGGGGAGGSTSHGGGGGGSYAVASTQSGSVPSGSNTGSAGKVEIGFLLSAPTVGSSASRGQLTSTSAQTPTECLEASTAAGDVLATSTRVLSWQGDGNLVLYKTAGGSVWESNTGNGQGTRCCFQTDGNLCIYNAAGTSIFCTSTADDQQGGNGGQTLTLQDDCNLVISNTAGTTLWAAGTSPCN